MATLSREGEIFVLDLGDGENRFTPEAVVEITGHLTEVAAAQGPRALVTTSTGKFFSNGLDLDRVLARSEELGTYVLAVQGLLADLLVLPVPTIAAIGGHAFAAGAMLALAHDVRVMRSDRGFFCLPEVDLGLPFTWGMSALIQSRLTPQVAHDAMTTGRRYGGDDAHGAGIVDHAVPAERVVELAVELVRPLAPKAGTTLGAIKERMYAEAVAQLRTGGSA